MKGNTVSVKGNVTRDAEVKRSQSGTNVLKFGIAWNQSKSDGNGGYKDVPHYFDVACFPSDRQLTVIQPHIVKGARCSITDGHLDYSEWESNGQKRSAVRIIVDDPIAGLLVVKPQEQGSQNNYVQNAQWNEVPTSVYDNDIPF